MPVITQKICLLGDFSVGKSSLIRRFVEDKFSDDYLSTVGVKVSRKSIRLKVKQAKHQVNLLIWDLEGHTRFKSITPTYLKGSSGAIIAADLTRKDTLENLNRHLNLFLEVNPQGFVAIALNKADLIEAEKLSKLLELYGSSSCDRVMNVYPTSAKTGQHVERMFKELTEKIVQKSNLA